MRTTIRLIDKYRNSGGEWIASPTETAKVEYAKKELAIFQKLEPAHDWKLQARGDQTDWHDWQQ